MSGDVQPRKRKDKRRKKEGTSLGSIHEPVASHKFRRSESDDLKSFDLPDLGEKIHVQSEHGIGGNICVKIIFFCLFGLLIGAVGLIYLKSQGSTDVDLPTIEESRFAEYFTGWLDDSADDHEHEAHESNAVHNGHEEHDDHDDHGDHENDLDEEDDHDHEEEPSIEQDLIYKLFGLQDDKDDKVDEVEEENVKAEEVSVSESAISHHDVDEDEDEENEQNNTDEEDDEEEEEKNGEDIDEDEKNNEEYTEENEDKEEEKDNDSIVDLKERVNDDSAEDVNDEEDKDENEDIDEDGVEDEDEEDLSQMDEDEEDKYISSHTGKTFEKDYEESEENGDGDDDDNDDNGEDESDKTEEKELNDEHKEDKSEREVMEDKEDDEDNEEDSKRREDFKVLADNDDLGFEEIYISEEDLGTEDEHKVKDDGEDSVVEEKTKKSAASELMEKLKAKQVESRPKKEEVEKEEEEDSKEAGGGVVVKLSVGIALIIVAHLVLVKKWKSMNNVPANESVPTVTKKQDIENLHSSVEPGISRRQTLVPENVCLNDDLDEEEIEEEDEEIGEGSSEEECEEEEFVKSKTDSWELFEKPAWNIQKEKNVEKEYEEPVDNEEIEDEEEYEEEDGEEWEEEQEQDEMEEEEEVEVEGDEEEEEFEEDDVEDENVKQKLLHPVSDRRQEEVKEAAPTPPPRTRHGRGGQDADDDDDNVSYFEEIHAVEESNQDDFTEDEINNNSGPEEQKAQEKKVERQDEWAFRQELDFADEQFANNPKAAVDAYNRIISKKPTMLRALVGRAKALDYWAEKEKSNAHLKQAINAYKTLLFEHGHLLDDKTYVKLAERCIERMRFAGNFISSIEIHKALILKYPDTPKYRNSLAVTYLMMNKIPQARVLLNETLSLWPGNGFALVHYGFILKTSDNNMEEGAKKLMAGIQTREEGVIEGMFFFHLGDALNRLGREKEAMKWYELGVKEGLFLSKYQRSLYNVDRLKGQPWWTTEETTYQQFFKKLEENWREIRREGLELLNSKGVNLFKEEAENLKDTGDWKQLDLYFRGKKQANCNKAPITCSLVSSFKPASTCTRGQIKFSVMLPNTHVWPHCGPTNCRLRSHLGLVVPKNTFIRVAEETRSWEEGKFIIFDDSFEHEVWHNGTGPRLVLIVDVWHPELSNRERRTLSPI